MASNLLAQTKPPSLDEILSRHGLEKKHLERKIPAEMRLELLPLLDDWKMTGYYLGFTEQNLSDIQIDNHNEERRRMALLNKWEQRHGEEATYLKLAEAFHHRQKIAAVERLCKRLKEMDGGSSARPGDEGDHPSEDVPGSSDNGSSTAECERLTRENAMITGHRNTGQKIQYRAAIKMENSQLKEEVIQLSRRLRHKVDQVHQLQYMLSRKGHEGVTLAEEHRETEATPTTSSAKDSQQ